MSVYIENFKRTEIKYLLNSNQFDSLFSFLQGFAKVDSYGKTRINNIYFDTPDYKLIRTSLEKPIYKEKLRLRTYGETTDDTNSFIEIKKKYDGIVYKRRVSGRYKDAFDYLVRAGKPLDDSQISREIAGFIDMYEDLIPAMRISYDRIAMAGIYDSDFRVTFDTKIEWDTESLDLRYKSIGIPILKEGEYMMEIKVKDSMSYELTEKLSELGIFPASFSKYGRGYEAMLRSRLHVGTLEERSVTSKKGVRAYA